MTTSSATPLPNIETSREKDAQRFAVLFGPNGQELRRRLTDSFMVNSKWSINDWRAYLDMELVRLKTHGNIAEYVLDNTAVTLAADNMRLREMLAMAHAGAGLYGDDGELQDSTAHPYIDFRRMSIPQIEEALAERAMKALAAAVEKSEPTTEITSLPYIQHAPIEVHKEVTTLSPAQVALGGCKMTAEFIPGPPHTTFTTFKLSIVDPSLTAAAQVILSTEAVLYTGVVNK